MIISSEFKNPLMETKKPTSHTITYPIVGSHYRLQADPPFPANAILDILPARAKLFLRQEPNHPITHKNAIGVWISTDVIEDLDPKRLTLSLANYRFELEPILAIPEHQLGYIPAGIAEKLDIGPDDIPAEFIFDPKGKYNVTAKINKS